MSVVAHEHAVQIIERHHNAAWKKRLLTSHYATTGRYTKAKQYDRDIAEAVAAELSRIVTELREAGYTITEQ